MTHSAFTVSFASIVKSSSRRVASGLLVTLLAVGVAITTAAPVFAQTQTTQTATRQFDIPSGALGSALLRFGEQSGLQFSVSSDLTRGKRTPGIKGKFTPEDGLRALLGGTRLTFRFTGPRTLVIEAMPDTGDARVLGPLRVEGADNGKSMGGGVNGSTDATATENSGTYGTTATAFVSKSAQSVLDTPQTVSVLSHQQISDQNIKDFTTAMAQLPGITVRPADSNATFDFVSRGFYVTNVRIDGGAPINNRSYYSPPFDMSLYDHIEVLRGADGMYSGYAGDPGGVVNLVRKRPLDHPQVLVEGQIASWNNERETIDVTGPLGWDGRLRGRAVFTHEDKDFFYDTAYDKHNTIYATLEADITPDFVLRGGFSSIDRTALPWQAGLPRYYSGQSLGLPRSTCLCFADSTFETHSKELFLAADYQINADWSLNANLSRTTQQFKQMVLDSFGGVAPDGSGHGSYYSGWRQYDRNPTVNAADVSLKGAFEMFGRKQNITFGGNYTDSYANIYGSSGMSYGGAAYLGLVAGVPAADPNTPYYIDVLHFNPNDPRYKPFNVRLDGHELGGTNEYTIYANWNTEITQKLKMNLGFRYSYISTHNQSQGYCNPYPLGADPLHCVPYHQDENGNSVPGDPIGIGEPYSDLGRKAVRDVDRTFAWPPSWSLIYTVNDNVSLYGSYTDTYASQASQLDKNLDPLPPVTGFNTEIGSNYLSDDGKLNGKLSIYLGRKEGFAVLDYDDPAYNQTHPDTSCCFVGGNDTKLTTYGLDLEVTGQIRPNWQVSASYNYNTGSYEYKPAAFKSHEPLTSFAPKHMMKLWTTYQFVDSGNFLDRLNVGGGVNMQTQTHDAGEICTGYVYVPNPVTGQPQPVCNSVANFQFNQGFYAIYSARIGFRINDAWTAALNINNVFDKTYYARTSPPNNDNWYGEPRNFALILSGKF